MATTTTAAKKLEDLPAPAPEAPLPLVDPARVSIDSQGFVSTSYFVRLPREIGRDLLVSPGIWKAVQSDRTNSLRKFDKVTIVDFDETYIVHATVAQANRDGASLIFERVHTLPTRMQSLYADADYSVRWDGGGFTVYRTHDNQKVSESFSAESQAIAYINTTLRPVRR